MVAVLVVLGPLGGGDTVRYTDLPAVDLPLPAGSEQANALAPAVPRVAIVLTEVGTSPAVGEAALRLPPAVGLVVPAYADDPAGWLARARAAGHEAYLEAPLQAARPELVDRGPMTLAPGQQGAEREKRLRWLIARATGFTGLAAEAGAFAASSAEADPILRAAAGAGLVMIELGGDSLANVAGAASVGFLSTSPPLDAPPVSDAVEAALGQIESSALRDGAAAGWGRARPRTLDHLRAWIASLDAKGLELTAPAQLAEDAS